MFKEVQETGWVGWLVSVYRCFQHKIPLYNARLAEKDVSGMTSSCVEEWNVKPGFSQSTGCYSKRTWSEVV